MPYKQETAQCLCSSVDLEHRSTEPSVAGSNPARGARELATPILSVIGNYCARGFPYYRNGIVEEATIYRVGSSGVERCLEAASVGGSNPSRLMCLNTMIYRKYG